MRAPRESEGGRRRPGNARLESTRPDCSFSLVDTTGPIDATKGVRGQLKLDPPGCIEVSEERPEEGSAVQQQGNSVRTNE